MSSPGQHQINQKAYSKLGSSYKVTHINRPRFEIFGKVLEFDINPKKVDVKNYEAYEISKKVDASMASKGREDSCIYQKSNY